MDSRILNETDKYYTAKIKEYGATNFGVDWNSVESQVLRFKQLSRIFENEPGKGSFSLCDYGCGYGSYVDYLMTQRPAAVYTGIDLSAEMINAAKEKYLGTDEEKILFLNSSSIDSSYDYIIASGIFNVRQKISDDDWKKYILEVLNSFQKYSQKGFAFNCLTKYSDAEYMKDYLYYADPVFLFDYAKRNFSHNVALLHDYELYEFTILVRK